MLKINLSPRNKRINIKKLDCNINNIIQTPPSQSSDEDDEMYRNDPLENVFSADDQYNIVKQTINTDRGGGKTERSLDR